ncbi:bromodomain-containing protein 4-like [Thrips palmi]|uniref:Bromodomain-containing protein 4-like n=1 Tax=Thrips palmi TaxID=161013 RepID=A0A6P8ZBW7_THRPL|nr:bromodomain-containing protein 4-like [Thrips palmi]XP_034245668.1 bromodomain-containing protein 4-like [Thrips palmi]XP_034245669.1 bromodomain-containing protein 4-like [Thrips palmi]
MESYPMALSSEADVHSGHSNTRNDGQHHGQTDQDRLALLHRARAKLSLSNRGGLLPEPYQNPGFLPQDYNGPPNGFFAGQDPGFHSSHESYPNTIVENPADLLKRAREKLTFSNRVEVHSNGTTADLQPGPSSEHRQKREEVEIQASCEPDVSPLERLRLARARLRSCVNSLPGSSAPEPTRKVGEREVERESEVKQSLLGHSSQAQVQQDVSQQGQSPEQIQQAVSPELQSLERIQQYDSPEVVHHGDDMDIESESGSGSPWREEEVENAPAKSTSESHFDFGIDVRKTFLMEPEIFELPVKRSLKAQKNVEYLEVMEVDPSCTDTKLEDKWSRSKNKTERRKPVVDTNDLDLFIINETSSFMRDNLSSKKTSHPTNLQQDLHLEHMDVGLDALESEPEVLEIKVTNKTRTSEHKRAPVDQTSNQQPPPPSETLLKNPSACKNLTGFTVPPPSLQTHLGVNSSISALPSMVSPPVPVPPPQFAVNSIPTPVPPPSVPKPVPPPFATFAAVPTPVPSPLVTMAIAHSSVLRNTSSAPAPVPPPQVNSSVKPESMSQLESFLGFSLSSILPQLESKLSSVPPEKASKSSSKPDRAISSSAASKPNRTAHVPPASTSKSSKTASLPPGTTGTSKTSGSSPAPPSTTKSSQRSPVPPTTSSISSKTSTAPPHVSSKSTKPSSSSSKPPKPTSSSSVAAEKPVPVTEDSTQASSADLPFAQAPPLPPKEAALEPQADARDSTQDSLFSLIPPPPPADSVDLDEMEDVDFSFTRLPPPPLGSGDFAFTRMPPPFFSADSEQAANSHNNHHMPFTRFPPPHQPHHHQPHQPHHHQPHHQGPPRHQGPQFRPHGPTWQQGRPSGPGPGQGQGRALLPTPVRPHSGARPPLLPTPKANFRSGRTRWGDYSPVEEVQPNNKPDEKPAEKPAPKFHPEQHWHGDGKGFVPSKSDRASTHRKHDGADSDSDSSMGAYDGSMHDADDYPSADEMETDTSNLKTMSDSHKKQDTKVEKFSSKKASTELTLKIESCTSTKKFETDRSDRPAHERKSHKSTDKSHSNIQPSVAPPIKIKLEAVDPELPMDIMDFPVNVKPDPDGPDSLSLHTSIELDVEHQAVVKIEPGTTQPMETIEENSYLCTECGKRFNDRFNLEAHLYDHLAEFTGKHPFRCPKCPGRVFKDMKLHRHHHLMGLECDVCGEAFHAAISLAEHRMRVHMAKKSYSCGVCNKRYLSSSDLAHHQKRRHSKPKKFKCKRCGKCFNHSDYLSKHVQKYHSEDRSSGSRDHPKEKDKEIKEKDKQSSKQLAISESLSCSHCKENFTTKDLLDEHIESTHTETKDKSNSCEVCDQTFTLVEDLQAHVVTHGENPFTCEDCDAKFPHKQELKDHSKKHRIHKCVLCGYITSSSSNLLKHMKNYHKDDVFECRNCDKWFPTEDGLKDHEETEHKKCHDDIKIEPVDSIGSNSEGK